MLEILSEKMKGCKDFCEELMNADKVLAEGVPGDMYWSTGLTKEQSLLVKKSSWPGKNIMGKVLTEIRESHKKKLKQNKHSQKSNLTQQSEESDSE